MKKWLVLDVHYLAHRAFHTSGHLTYKGIGTGVIFGLLKSISVFKDEFMTDRVVFCFEDRTLLRRKLFPEYKRHRHIKQRTPEEIEALSSLAIQINELHHRHLPHIGFRNVFSYAGMESDDIMAALCKACPEQDEIVLVTSDSDLWQCLRSNVSIFSPQKNMIYTHDWFTSTYSLKPSQWAVVKAMAGCSSDGVPGIPGIGEKTALRYLRGELSSDSAAYKKIQAGKAIVRRNRALVELPFEGCPTPQLQEDNINTAGWREVCGKLGMKSLAHRPPVATRKLGL